ncbi:hypothetical protein BVC93_00530 [Mycobacterium sp. MS1601]|uniref:hypothetical protein n=1 Tax=Mycobacterium sp. MS1601 TaxID=1936029 RepID=UPI0009792FBB|nr:hypothetical protein BVC93_00530 [Mycobacterium sp. MS1601]
MLTLDEDVGILGLLIETVLEHGPDDLTIVSNNRGVDGSGLCCPIEARGVSRVIARCVGTSRNSPGGARRTC